MNCKSVQTWLLQAESLRSKSWPAQVGQHVDSCAACAKLVRGLTELEDDWRDQPLPASANKAKNALMKKQRRMQAGAATLPFLKRLAKPLPWVAAAAMFLLGVSLFAWFSRTSDRGNLPDDPKIAAAPSVDVVERLVEWNLEMTNATKDERKRLLEQTEQDLREDLIKAKPKLTPEDRELAEDLLDAGVWLAAHDDPFEESDKVSKVAEKLAERVETAAKKGNPRERKNHELFFLRFMQRGVHPLEQRISQMKPPQPPPQWKPGSKKGPFDHKMNPWWGNPKQFQQKQMEMRKNFDALRNKGWGKGFGPHGGFGKKR